MDQNTPTENRVSGMPPWGWDRPPIPQDSQNRRRKVVVRHLRNPDLETILPGFPGNLQWNGRFISAGTGRKGGYRRLLKWRFTPNPQKAEKKADPFRLSVHENDQFLAETGDFLVWLGHASFVLRLAGVTVITDPIFFDMPFVPRLAPMPLPPEKLAPITYTLLSHGHRDHMDLKSLRLLWRHNPSMTLLGPLGASQYLSKERRRGCDIQEAGWFQKFRTVSEVEIFFLPAAHWHRRTLTDYNRMLWGSFVIRGAGKTVFFAGDTAAGAHFAQIGQLFPEIDVALMPIGAYKPEYIMKRSHLSPLEAIEAFNALGARVMIPMHFGTYDLASEPLGEPPRLLRQHATRLQGRLRFLSPGEVFCDWP